MQLASGEVCSPATHSRGLHAVELEVPVLQPSTWTAAAEFLLKAVADTGHFLSPGVRPLLSSAAQATSPGSSIVTSSLRPCLVLVSVPGKLR